MIWNTLILAANIVWFNQVYGRQSELGWYIYNNSVTTNVTVAPSSTGSAGVISSHNLYEIECFGDNSYSPFGTGIVSPVGNGTISTSISSPIEYDSVNNIVNEIINLTCRHSLTNGLEASCDLLLYLNTSINFTWSIYYSYYNVFLDANANLYTAITTSSPGLVTFMDIPYQNNTDYKLFETKSETNTNQGSYNLYTYRVKPILNNYGYSNYTTGNSTTKITLIISYTNTSVVTEGCCCLAIPTPLPTPSPSPSPSPSSSVNMLTIHSSYFFLIMFCIILINIYL